MKRTVRLISLLVALVMLFAMLAGCSDNGGAEETAEPTKAAATPSGATAAPTEEPVEESFFPLAETVELTYWRYFPTFLNAYIEDLFDNYGLQSMYEDTNVKLDIIYVGANQNEQFNIMISGGDYTDIMQGVNVRYTGGASNALDQGIIVDIETLPQEWWSNYKAVIDSFDESVYKTVHNSDGSMGEFYCVNAEEPAPGIGPLIRQDWLDDLGLDTPKTYDAYYNVLTAFKTSYGIGSPMLLQSVGVQRDSYLVAGFGIGAYVSSEQAAYTGYYHVGNEVRFGPEQPEFKEYLTMMNQWYSEGLIDPDFMSRTIGPGGVPHDGITTDEAGIFIGRSSYIPTWLANAENENIRITAIPDAVKQEGDMNHIRYYEAIVNSQNENLAISTKCENIEIACRYIDYTYTERGILFNNYGMEDVTFEYDSSGNPQYTDFILNNPDGMGVDTAVNVWVMINGSVLDPNRLNFLLTEDQLAAGDIWKSQSDIVYAMGSVSLAAEQSGINSQYWSDITGYVHESTLLFITGGKSLDEFDSYVETLKNLNVDIVTGLWQDAYNEFMAR